MQQIKQNTRGISTIIATVLGLVIVVVIVANVVLWNYEMNQLDWDKMKEDITITDVTRVTNSSWSTAQSEYTVNTGSLVSGNYTNTQVIDDLYERFRESTGGGGSQPIVGWFRYATPSPPVSTAGDNEAILDTQGPGGGDKKEMSIKGSSPNGYFYNTTGAMSYSAGEWAIKLFRSVAEGPSVTFDVYIETTSQDGLTVVDTVKFWDDLVCTDSTLTLAWLNYTATSSYSTNSSTRLRVRFVWQSGAALKIYYNGSDGEGYGSRIIAPPTGGLNSELDINGAFVIDLSTYPVDYIQTVEIQLKYRANDTGENWYLKAHNWTATAYSDSGFNNTSGHTPTTGWDTYAVNLTDRWSSYVNGSGAIYVKMQDNQGDVNQTTIDIDFLAVRVMIDGARFTFENEGSVTVHMVSLWINNSTLHQRYDMDIIVNSAETYSYIRADISLASGSYTVKVVTKRGNKATYTYPS